MTATPTHQPKTGWWNPEPLSQRSRWHWVTETGRTACGRYAYLRGTLEQGNDESAGNCAACRKKKAGKTA